MEELLDPEDTLQDEVALASSDKLVSMMLRLELFFQESHGTHEFASDPYVQSCSETAQDVHGLLPSHLQSNTISTLFCKKLHSSRVWTRRVVQR